MKAISRFAPSVLFTLLLGLASAGAASADPAKAQPELETARAATKSAAASDAKVDEIKAQKVSETAAYREKKTAHAAEMDALTAAYNGTCPPGYAPERRAECERAYATYSRQFDEKHQQFTSEVYDAYSRRWDALDAEQKLERANAENQRAAAARALGVLLTLFPNCSLGDGGTAALESALSCFSEAWDSASHQIVTVDAQGHIVWNDRNPNAKKYHQEFDLYATAQAADAALLQTLGSQPASGERDMRIAAIKARREARSQKMDFLIYQARTASK